MTGAERLLAACRREAVDATPVWFMRQAGGSLPGYLAMRERLSVEGIAADPDRCAEVSVMPVEAYGVDGADIMLPLAAMGVSLTLTPAGPVVEAPIRSAADVDRLRPLDPDADLPSILGAIRLVRAALAGRAATIGITGAPYTLASYLIEGGPSRDQARARAFMYRETAAWARLMHRLATAMAAYATAQVRAGAQVIQVFDSWAGALGPDAYRLGAAPYSRHVLDAIERAEKRLADGTYGLSVESGRPIPDERLETIPWAERTADELPCAKRILSTLAHRAYRRPVTDEDLNLEPAG